jgi:hypothetical protein
MNHLRNCHVSGGIWTVTKQQGRETDFPKLILLHGGTYYGSTAQLIGNECQQNV